MAKAMKKSSKKASGKPALKKPASKKQAGGLPRAPSRGLPRAPSRALPRALALALAQGLITKKTQVLDWAPANNRNIRLLEKRGIRAKALDPEKKTRAKKTKSDVVHLGYVINAIQDPHERMKTLVQAFEAAGHVLIVSVHIDVVPGDFEEYEDEAPVKKKSFVMRYTQSEFQQFIETVLGRRAQVATLGVAYVFADAESEARFIATKAFSRRLEYRPDLLQTFSRDEIARKYVSQAKKLGRMPSRSEFKKYDKLIETYGTRANVQRLCLKKLDKNAFEGTQDERGQDILMFFGMMRFEALEPPPLKFLAPSIQKDLKSIWKSHKKAVSESDTHLFGMGNPDTVYANCKRAGVGVVSARSLKVHASAEDELPALLRIIIHAAKKIVGTIDYDIVQISTDGRSVSFLTHDGFDDVAHPVLKRKVEVFLPRPDYSIREYALSHNPPVLHRKERFVAESYPHYAEFSALSEKEQKLGLFSFPDINRRDMWETVLKSRGYTLKGHVLKKSS